jgi:hypothetical protein
VTESEYDQAVRTFGAFFQTGFNPPKETLGVWYLALKDIPAPVFRNALGLITRSTDAWKPWSNLVALVESVKREAWDEHRREECERSRVTRADRLLEGPTPPAEAKARINAILKGLGLRTRMPGEVGG